MQDIQVVDGKAIHTDVSDDEYTGEIPDGKEMQKKAKSYRSLTKNTPEATTSEGWKAFRL
jgi:hypothetical protein